MAIDNDSMYVTCGMVYMCETINDSLLLRVIREMRLQTSASTLERNAGHRKAEEQYESLGLYNKLDFQLISLWVLHVCVCVLP
jgi:hypothetical protein